MSDKNLTRRSFIQIFAGAVVGAPALLSMRNLFAAGAALPAGQKPVLETAPMAKALGYKQDATKVDAVRFKKYVAGQSCTNCSNYTKKNDSWGECKIIKGGLVSVTGWCSSYTKKAS